ncbi:unnamed protein product [Boreogadus saida]
MCSVQNGTCHSPFRRTEAEVLEAAVAWSSWRRPTWKGWHGGPGGGSSSSQKGLEAANLEGLETAAVLEATAGLEAEANLEVLESVGLEGLEAAAILEADYLEVLEADCGGHPGGPGGGVHMAAAGLEAVANLEGLEAAILESLEAPAEAILEATAANLKGLEPANLEGLEAVVETNLEGLEAVVGSVLEGPAAAASWRARRRRRPGGPGGGGVLEGPAAAASSWRARRRRRPGGPGGGGGSSSSDVAEVQAVGPVEVLEETVPAVEDGGGDPAVEVRRRLVFRPTSSSSMEAGLKESLGMKITAEGLTTPPPPPPTHLSGEASSWCRRSNLHLFEETKQLDD